MTDMSDDSAPGARSFLDELKRRKVVRAATVYVAVAYAVIEFSDLVLPRLSLPDWSVTLVVVLAIAGFPLALIGAWIFELKEGGLARTSETATTTASGGRTGWMSPRTIVAVVILLALGVTAGWIAGRTSAPDDRSSSLRSIAVLPFADMSPDGDMEYFGDGMAEEILNVLAKLPDLKVAGRTSSFSFKNRDVDLRTIGEALEVETILEGSVRRSATEMRVTAQLIRADDQSHIWSETFDHDFDEDVFEVQESIARAIANALQVERGEQGAPSVADQRGTDRLEAYDAYLLGRFRWGRRTPDGVLGSIDAFQEAVRLDPGYARAYSGLADAYAIASNFGWMAPREAFPLARAAVDRALELDADLPEAHVSLGAILSWYEWDHEAAAAAYRRAIELDPNQAFARYWYALTLDYTNRRAEARVQLDSALRAEPLALQIRNGLGNHFQWWGELEAAIDQYGEILRIDPTFQNARRWRAEALILAGRHDEAMPMLDSLPVDFSPLGVPTLRGLSYALSGWPAEARALLDDLQPGILTELPSLLRAYSAVGDLETAFAWLQEAVDRRDYNLLSLVFIPASDPLRTDPRFDRALETIGVSRYWQ